MSDPRYDKVNPDVGLFRAPLAADLPTASISTSGGFGPVAVSLNASGQVVIGTAGQSGFVGVLVKNLPLYPRMGNIPGQYNLGVPIGGKAGNIVDIMTAGEITQMPNGTVAGTAYYAAQDGTLTTNPDDGPQVGYTVGTDRLVVRADIGGTPGGGATSTTANGAPVANTVVETALLTRGLDANEVQPGSVYELDLWGIYSNTGTPAATFNVRLGGTGGTLLASVVVTTPTAGANDAFRVNARVNFHSATKATAIARAEFSTHTTQVDVPGLGGSNGEVTVATNVAQTLGVDLVWGAASASNTLTLTGGSIRRIA